MRNKDYSEKAMNREREIKKKKSGKIRGSKYK